MQQPDGYITQGQEQMVCRLHKSLYGLKQASRTWNGIVTTCMVDYGFRQCVADPCVFILDDGTAYTIAAFWVDDGLLASSDPHILENVIQHIQRNFAITSRELEHFVGLRITRDRTFRRLFVSQPSYLEQLLKKFNMSDCFPKTVPADPDTILSANMGPSTEEHKATIKNLPYRRLPVVYSTLLSQPAQILHMQSGRFLSLSKTRVLRTGKLLSVFLPTSRAPLTMELFLRAKTNSCARLVMQTLPDVLTLVVPSQEVYCA